METSKVSDECSSSESGWTTYLASPMQDDGFYDNEDDENENEDHISSHKRVNIDENEDRSDDSMASDASSGPSHMEVSYSRSKKNQLFGQNQSKLYAGNKSSKQVEKGGKFGAEKEVIKGNANAPTCYSQTAAKEKIEPPPETCCSVFKT